MLAALQDPGPELQPCVKFFVCECTGWAVRPKHLLLMNIGFFKWSNSRKSATVKTSKDTAGTKLKSANENYGYHSDESRTTREWLGLDRENVRGGAGPPNTISEGICLALGGHYLGCNF